MNEARFWAIIEAGRPYASGGAPYASWAACGWYWAAGP